MSTSNEILPFAGAGGANVQSQADYLAASLRTSGNQPGVAVSALNNKALRQSSYMASQLAQFLVNKNSMSVLDNATPAQLLAKITAALTILPPVVSSLLSGSGTYNLTYVFFIATGNATAGATYTDSGSTVFTVVTTIASGTTLYCTGGTAPVTDGNTAVLTKTGGTGDATITYYAVRSPIRLYAEIKGGGGGGASSDVNDGVSGTDTTFGVSTAGGGGGGVRATSTGLGGTGGTGTLGTGTTGIAISGGKGNSAQSTALVVSLSGGKGAGGGGGGGGYDAAGTAAAANTGGGGGGGATTSGNAGAGGGEGASVRANFIGAFLLSAFAYGIGPGGAGGSAGAGHAGGAGGSGHGYFELHFQ